MSESDVADELAAGFADAWNSHEMDEFARLFHEDAVFVTVRGTYLNGQEEIRRHHAAGSMQARSDSQRCAPRSSMRGN